MSSTETIEKIADTLGWTNYETTGSVGRGPTDKTISIDDGVYWYLVDADAALDWATDYEHPEDDGTSVQPRPYDDFCSAIDELDPLDVIPADERDDWAGLCGVNGDIENRIMDTPEDLDDLLRAIESGQIELTPDLPTFGGEEPSNTWGVWSWDADRLLVTEDGELAIVDREDWL